MSTRHSLYPATFNDGGDNDLTQMNGFGIRPNSQVAAITPGGALDRAHVGLSSASPVCTFTTRVLAGFFGWDANIPTLGLNCTGGATFRLQRRADGGAFATGANHETYTSTQGFLRPVTLSCSQTDTDGAMLSCEYTPTWDGSTRPLVHNTTVDFTLAPAPAFSSRFFCGPVYHNAVQIPSIEGWSYDFGINYTPRAFDGNAFAKEGSIITRSPALTITTADQSVGAAIDAFMSAVNTSFAAYLQKGASSTDRVAALTAQHVKVTISAGEWHLDEASVQGNEDGSASFMVTPTGTVAVVTNSAIP